jgi:RNA polymerase sigma factor (sigma-70 family)
MSEAGSIAVSDDLAIQAKTSERALTHLLRSGFVRITKYARAASGRFWYTSDRADLRQQARIGVCTAVQKYEPSKGHFWTFAQWWIRHEVTRWLAYCGTPIRYTAESFRTHKIDSIAWLDATIGEDGYTLGDLIDGQRASADYEEPMLAPTSESLETAERRSLAWCAVRDLTPEAGYVVRRRVIDRIPVPRVADEMWIDTIAVEMIERCAVYDMRRAVQLELFRGAA